MSQEIKEILEAMEFDEGLVYSRENREKRDQALAILGTEPEPTIKVFDEIEMDAKRIFENIQANLKEYRSLKNSDSKPENTLAGGYLVYAEKYCEWGVKLTQDESKAPEPPPAGAFAEFMEDVKDEIRKAPKMFHQLQKRDELIRELQARLDRSEASRKELLTALENSPSADAFVSFANFAEQCTKKSSMAIYRGRFLGLATFLRSCVDRAEKIEAAIAKEGGE